MKRKVNREKKCPALAIGIWLIAACMPLAKAASGVPSDFSTTVGDAVLCFDKVAPGFYEDYLQTFFGPPYKTVGNKKWYQVNEVLWRHEHVSDIVVGESPPFIAAIVQASPESAANAILQSNGVTYTFTDHNGISPEYGQITAYNGMAEVFCLQN